MKKAIIIGAGPAGITAAYELLEHTEIVPLIVEATKDIGGLSQTVNYKGNRIDIGGHRFFSKSKRVMDWWLQMLPLEKTNEELIISYQNKKTTLAAAGTAPVSEKEKMLIRNRQSRILFAGKLFEYPIKLNPETVRKLGFTRIVRIGFSYMKANIFPKKVENSLEDFFINRFGKELYLTFFKDYTEKVWGVPCTDISPEWGRQRIKNLSLTSAIINALKPKKKSKEDISQSDTETSLIEKFLYPALGPGQLWELAVSKIKAKGGSIAFDEKVIRINATQNHINSISTVNPAGEEKEYSGDYFISSMPVVELVAGLGDQVPSEVKQIANGLVYRDFIIVGILVNKLKLKNKDGSAIKDNWIYIQEANVKIGRLQVYNNWSPYMVNDSNSFWLGLEYFCNTGDALWNKSDAELIELAKNEIALINIIEADSFLDATVVRMPKAYPTYTGAYDKFEIIKNYTDHYDNLFLVGRNGMHKYNNQDHSMLTAMLAVENIKNGVSDKSNIWGINAEELYHEE
jgi:protoporphyrinogen oxidase